MPGDGRIGVYAFVPVFAKGLPLRTAAQRRDALTGLVAGAVVTSELVRTAMTGLPNGLDVRVTDGPTVLAEGPTGTAIAHAELGGRTWRVSLAPAAASPLAPIGTAFAGLALMLLLVVASLRLRRREASEAALETTLTRERTSSAHALARAESTIDDEQRTRRLVADASDALVLEIDRDGLIKSCSAAAEQLLGYTAEELVGDRGLLARCTRTTCFRPRTALSAIRARTEPTSCSKAAGSRAATSSGSSPASSPSSAARPP